MDHSDSKTLNDLTNKLNKLIQESMKKNSPKKPSNDFSPVAKRLRKKEPEVPNKTLDEWLRKKDLLPSTSLKNPKPSVSKSPVINNIPKETVTKSKKSVPESSKRTSLQVKTRSASKLTNLKVTRSSSKQKNIKCTSSSVNKQTNLKSFLSKKSSTKKPVFKRFDSSDSCELPTFTKVSKTKKQKALFKKYGVVVPTVDEMLKDKEELEKDKNALESFNPMNEDSLEFEPFTEQIVKGKENILDCKHLTLQELSKSFKENHSLLDGIINGEIKNNRHDRYFDKNTKVLTYSYKDLTYSTSTIVFSFEQKEHLLELLKAKFDPDDLKTQYFFQVLLPELCLRIFMETYQMEYEVAVKYLSEQPIIES